MAFDGLALVAAAFALAGAPVPATSPFAGQDWLTCSSVRSPEGRVTFIDQLLFIIFGSGSARIDAEGAAMLDRFAAHVVTPPGCHVEIAAHADRVGSADANLALSRRRADAVRAYLRSRGVAAAIAAEAFGETRPVVETADGVAEPQNRRAEIFVTGPEG
jgi:outer membrane protein OmpA-like peptidoglycan-associated protein